MEILSPHLGYEWCMVSYSSFQQLETALVVRILPNTLSKIPLNNQLCIRSRNLNFVQNKTIKIPEDTPINMQPNEGSRWLTLLDLTTKYKS